MPIGMLTCCAGVFAGGLLGSLLRRWIGEDMRRFLPQLFGLTAMCSGVLSVCKAAQMPTVTLAMILGGWLGHALRLEQGVSRGLDAVLKRLPRPEGFDMKQYVTVTSVLCASGFGLYAVMVESFSGERSQMFSKAMLDFFSAAVFGSSLGFPVSLIAIPQLGVFTLFFLLARVLMPVMDAAILNNFIACGGVLTIAAGMRMAGIRDYPLIDLLPALVLAPALTPLLARAFG